eukprot:gnl/MRDRNA2_/MRDRNA2_164566_c0_seq1.p1 gnl/MRDRNA2_/MRDRNA2_164566_c0~~gnl/MRDRNA2_/MRDRNA2_164566_c0_seq1.p1  ORF type:complete len:323 (-),score=65.81 gnl/MRDRNA2_/MRDRNA2_164566_c0_seq1:107-1075(-)
MLQQDVAVFPVSSSFRVSRSEMKVEETPFDVCGTACVMDGEILQVNTIDQFAESFLPLIDAFKAPSASCGYFSIANALLVAENIKDRSMSVNELQSFIDSTLRNVKCVTARVEDAMCFIQDSRKSYIQNHQKDFPSYDEQEEYMRAWVANYEISDYLQKSNAPQNSYFFRYNQWPERDAATHEERDRIEEEREFGSDALGNKGSVPLMEGATRFILERFQPQRMLQRPEAWLSEHENEVSFTAPVLPCIFIVDVNGHFLVAFDAILDGKLTLVVINTTAGSYLQYPALSYIFDLVFGVKRENSNGCTTRCGFLHAASGKRAK